MDDIDEDSLTRETVADEVAQPEKQRAGRPPGYPKSGGRIKGKIPGQKYNDAEAHAVLGSMMPDVVKFHYDLMLGRTKGFFSGPTGKTVERFPNLNERQKSADWLAENFWKLDGRIQAAVATTPKAFRQVEEADPDALRKAVLDDLMAHMPAQAAPPPVVDNVAPQVDPADGGVVEHISSDPAVIAEFERNARSGKKKTKRTFDENNPKPGDRLDLPCNFYAISELDPATNKVKWTCLNERNEVYAYKATAEAVRKHFWEFTSVGQAEAERLGKGEGVR